jgi:hypothetical protein
LMVVAGRDPLFGKMLPHAVGGGGRNAENKHASICAQEL